MIVFIDSGVLGIPLALSGCLYMFFRLLSEVAEVIYKTTDYYCREGDRTISWNDPDLGIELT